MRRPSFKRVFPQALAWVAAVAFCGALALAQNPAPASGQRTDGQIEMDVVQALDASQPLQNDLITAATIQSEVTLSGTVSSEFSRTLAESIVKGVPGVTAVHNNLRVGNPADDQSAQDTSAPDAGGTDTANNQPYDPAQAAGTGPAPGYGQNAPPADDPNAPPDYGQNQPPVYGQAPPPGDGQQAPPPGYGQGPPPPYARAPYPGSPRQPYPPQNAPAPPSGPAYRFAERPVTVPQGTLLQLRTSEPVGSKRATEGTPVQFIVIQDVTFGGVLAIPRGATIHGVVTEVRRPEPGALTGSSELALRLVSLELSGQIYPLQSDLFKVKGPGKGQRTAGNVIGGALIGAIIGGAAGGGTGAAIGAVAGGGVGTAASAASSGPGVWIPAEAQVTFHLAVPVTVNPVSQQEADQLAQGLYPGGPQLYRRGGYGGYYGRPYRYRVSMGYGYPYGYPPVYYRPYYFSGGFYYWR